MIVWRLICTFTVLLQSLEDGHQEARAKLFIDGAEENNIVGILSKNEKLPRLATKIEFNVQHASIHMC